MGFEKILVSDESTAEYISYYPYKSRKILDSIFSLGKLLPGTKKGRKAFCYAVNDMDNLPDSSVSFHNSYHDNVLDILSNLFPLCDGDYTGVAVVRD